MVHSIISYCVLLPVCSLSGDQAMLAVYFLLVFETPAYLIGTLMGAVTGSKVVFVVSFICVGAGYWASIGYAADRITKGALRRSFAELDFGSKLYCVGFMIVGICIHLAICFLNMPPDFGPGTSWHPPVSSVLVWVAELPAWILGLLFAFIGGNSGTFRESVLICGIPIWAVLGYILAQKGPVAYRKRCARQVPEPGA